VGSAIIHTINIEFDLKWLVQEDQSTWTSAPVPPKTSGRIYESYTSKYCAG
jgi:hypothetical protein